MIAVAIHASCWRSRRLCRALPRAREKTGKRIEGENGDDGDDDKKLE